MPGRIMPGATRGQDGQFNEPGLWPDRRLYTDRYSSGAVPQCRHSGGPSDRHFLAVHALERRLDGQEFRRLRHIGGALNGAGIRHITGGRVAAAQMA